MPGRRSFKTDKSFLEKLALGAIPSRCRKSAIRDLKAEIKRSVPSRPARFPEKLPTFFICSLANRFPSPVGREKVPKADEGTGVGLGESGRRSGEGGSGSLCRPDAGDLPAPRAARQAGIVLDIFAGCNTTGSTAVEFICHLKSAISNQAKRYASAFRFVDELPAKELGTLWSRLHSDDLPVEMNRQQRESMLMEKPDAYAGKSKRE